MSVDIIISDVGLDVPTLSPLVCILSSAIDVAVVARVASCFAGSRPLKAQPILVVPAKGEDLPSDFLNSKG